MERVGEHYMKPGHGLGECLDGASGRTLHSTLVG